MTEFTGLDLEMEIKESYTEVLDILEGVLLHIFRGLQGQLLINIPIARMMLTRSLIQSGVPTRLRQSKPSTLLNLSSSPNQAKRSV